MLRIQSRGEPPASPTGCPLCRESTLEPRISHVARERELVNLGLRNFDAFHVACAELAGADAFATTDDRLLALAKQHEAAIRIRLVDVVTLTQEIFR